MMEVEAGAAICRNKRAEGAPYAPPTGMSCRATAGACRVLEAAHHHLAAHVGVVTELDVLDPSSVGGPRVLLRRLR